MIREGAFENYHTDVIFGQHIITDFEVGTIGYKPGGTMASVDGLDITVRGNQTHGAYPWKGVDPIVTSAQIILGLQSITSRQLDLTTAPAVITIGSIHGGVRSNIIPDEVRMIGTIRSLDPEMRADIHQRIRRTAEWIALSAGATAEVTITIDLPITYNDPDVTERMLTALERITGRDGLILSKVHTGGEDFAFFAEQIPGFYYFLGVRPKGTDPGEAIPLHSPYLFVDEGALIYGVRAMASLAVEYMMGK